MNKWDYVLAILVSLGLGLWVVFGFVLFAVQEWRFTFFYFLLLFGLLVASTEDIYSDSLSE